MVEREAWIKSKVDEVLATEVCIAENNEQGYTYFKTINV